MPCNHHSPAFAFCETFSLARSQPHVTPPNSLSRNHLAITHIAARLSPTHSLHPSSFIILYLLVYLFSDGSQDLKFHIDREEVTVRSLAFFGQAESPEANTETRPPDL
jgi:hypothetical protein